MNRKVLLPITIGLAAFAAGTFQNDIAEWRKQREEKLKAEGGWLSLAGLFWLHEGANPFGKDPALEIPLPDGPARAGAFELRGGKVTLQMNGASRAIEPNGDDPVKIGRLSLFVIQRGPKLGIRVKDPQSEARTHFRGIESYPAQPEYRIAAKWLEEPKELQILNIIGITEPMRSPGVAVFQLHGKPYRLRPVFEDPDTTKLFYIFKDETSGKETYPAGRFFYSDLPKNGEVVIDFNKAYNPPCAFTDFATCPLPPPENRLAVRIEAGEKKYGH